MSKNNVIIAVLLLFLILSLVSGWMGSDGKEKRLKREYENLIAKQDSIIESNNTAIEGLNLRLDSLDSERDSLIIEASKIDKEIIYINNARNETHSTIDTVGVGFIYRYWSDELHRYDSTLLSR